MQQRRNARICHSTATLTTLYTLTRSTPKRQRSIPRLQRLPPLTHTTQGTTLPGQHNYKHISKQLTLLNPNPHTLPLTPLHPQHPTPKNHPSTLHNQQSPLPRQPTLLDLQPTSPPPPPHPQHVLHLRSLQLRPKRHILPLLPTPNPQQPQHPRHTRQQPARLRPKHTRLLRGPTRRGCRGADLLPTALTAEARV